MARSKKEAFTSPLGVFFIYILVSFLLIMGFRFFFPGEAAPLAFFLTPWRLIRGCLDCIALFPALFFSALVIPFGFRIRYQEIRSPFTPQFLQLLKMSIITAIVGAVLYGFLVFLILPIAQDYETKLRSRGRLYSLAEERAREHAASKEWAEAAQFVAVCETIWPQGPQIAKLKTEVNIQAEAELIAKNEKGEPKKTAPVSGNPQPVNAAEALARAATALAEERYFDAHWLATLAGQLAKPGSVEQTEAARLADTAWSKVNSLAPNAQQTNAYKIYRLKRDGYEALITGEYIRSYYIFRELQSVTPEDPDVGKYLSMSENSVTKTAFFIDEMDMNWGKTLSGELFSLPLGSGRMVMRISSLTTLPDSAYCIGIEIMALDGDGRPLWTMEAPYAKILPLNLNSAQDPGAAPFMGGAASSVVVILRALDRKDGTRYWEPVVHSLGQNAPNNAQVVLPVSWDNFLLLTKVRQGLAALTPAELRTASRNLGGSGYLPHIFDAELLYRFALPLLLLPLGICAIIIGWRYRALKRPRYMGIPMLGILPLVFYGVMQFCQGWINSLGILAVVSLDFTTAAAIFGIGILVFLVVSLILLAAQHD